MRIAVVIDVARRRMTELHRILLLRKSRGLWSRDIARLLSAWARGTLPEVTGLIIKPPHLYRSKRASS